MEQANDGVIERVEYRQGGGKIIQFFSCAQIYSSSVRLKYLKKNLTPSMEDGRPNPRVEAGERPDDVILLHRMGIRDLCSDSEKPPSVRPKVQDRESDGGRLLHPSKPPERPFSIVLVNFIPILDVLCGDMVHAYVLAIVGASPSGYAQRQRKCNGLRNTLSIFTARQAVFEVPCPVSRGRPGGKKTSSGYECCQVQLAPHRCRWKGDGQVFGFRGC